MKLRGRVASIGFCLAGTLAITAACGGGAPAPAGGGGQPEAGGGSQAYRVAMLLPGPYNDHGWDENGYDALQSLKAQNVQVAYTENVQQSDQAGDFQGYAAQGFNVMVGHGFQFFDAAVQVSKSFPKSWFIIDSSPKSQAPNVIGINGDTYQEGYLAGVVAALLSKSHVVGAVGGQSDPPITNALDGFKEGAEHTDPTVKVLTALTGSYADVAKASEFARTMIGQKADVLIGDANQATIGVVQACKERSVQCIGINTDQHSLAPDNIPVSVVQDYGPVLGSVVQKIRVGQAQATTLNAGIPDGQYKLSQWYGNVPDNVKQQAEQVQQQIKSGALKLAR